MTLVEALERNTREKADNVAIVYRNSKISYCELNEQVNRLAHAFLDSGLEAGDRIGFMLTRVPEIVITMLASAKIKGVCFPVNFEFKPDMIKGILEKTSPRFLVIHSAYVPLAKKAASGIRGVEIIGCTDESIEGCLKWDEFLRGSKTVDPSFDIEDDTLFYLNYTSGSTGVPKGALTTHANVYWNTMAAIEGLKIIPSDVHLCMFAPFAHPHEIFSRALYLGGVVVLLDKISPKAIAKSIEENSVTCFMGLAPMYETLLQSTRDNPSQLKTLRVPESGGMFTRPELIERFESQVGVPILPVWGSTETTGIAINNSPGEKQRYGSVGSPCKYYEVRIVNDADEDVPPNEVGEMIFKGNGVVKGYFEEDGDKHKCFKDGWYYSGDLGRQDEDGYVYFIDRKSGMMKVAGLMVYPSEIELQLLNHPLIKEAAVIRHEDKLRGEVPKAYIVLGNGAALTEREVMRYCNEYLPHYKVPKIIEFIDQLPKTGSGKINKKALEMEML